jgi:hypothetical protein
MPDLLRRVREEELLYVLHKLRELRLWPGSLWAALSETPSKYAKEQPGTHTISYVPHKILTDVLTHLPEAVDTSLPPAELIADSVKRSSRAHMFHFYSLLCEIASVPRKAPSAWISADRLAVLSGVPAEKEKKEMDAAATDRTHDPRSSRPGAGHIVSFDARELARECLKGVGRELGVSR